MDNSEKALQFLETIYPQGPWCLTAIDTNKAKALDTKTFYPATRGECLTWIRGYNGVRNLYFHVNPVMHALSKKAERTDIAAVAMLHVDVDPGIGQDLKTEQDKIIALFSDKLPKGVPMPSCVTFSGGGYQAFWFLKDALPVNGDLARAEDAKLYNKQLEILFGGDNCHNIDRLMRLPFSMNMPDAKKREKGRTETLATVVWCKPELRYDIVEFKQAPALQADKPLGSPSGRKVEVKVSGNVRRIADEELEQVLGEYGVHPNYFGIIRNPLQAAVIAPKPKDNSRSAWLFDVVCNLARANVPDEIIFSIITDPEQTPDANGVLSYKFGIAASVVELKSNAERYAIKQIASAKEWVIDPNLQEMNEKFMVIGDFGGKCLVVWEEEDIGGLKRTRLKKQSFPDFEKRYMNQRIKIGEDAAGNPKFMKKGKWWLEHPHRSQVDRVVFAPDKVDVPDALNLWKGFSVTTKPGDRHLGYLRHVKEIICCNDEVNYDYLIKWMARAVQYPASPGQVAIVLQGGRGAGKGFFVQMFGNLFGRHFLQVSNASHLVGNFNAHLRDALIMFSDEAFYAGDRKHNSTLKTLITEDILPIEGKGVDVEFGQNYTHLIMASNEEHVVRTGIDERRFFILRVSEDKKQDTEYFDKMAKEMEAGGRENLLHFLREVDLEGFQVRNVPKTVALREQTDMSLDVRDEWLYRVLKRGSWFENQTTWERNVPRRPLYESFVKDVTIGNRYAVPGTDTAFGLWIKSRLPRVRHGQPNITVEVPDHAGFIREIRQRTNCYVMPTLAEARAAWDKYRGKAEEWDPVEEES